ncbi:putative D-arabinono-1,4-lactone oxidase [Pseudocercospora fuligena]|uniref:D-arabinono-1,4-lactone oxidase n=1 Tax=Pseudocercospora fuligena TaxID=685502 RepID=A0A8H6RM59_9PEZI|nr:putative D-arabinono-1,4-lactone oxidase [Pseudocercospora fuligena]
MEKVQQEIDRTDPDVPFRATDKHVHYTWARTFQSRPELYIKPRTLPEIQKIVTLARRCRKRLVAVGCGHSPSDLTCSSSWMVNLDDFSKVLKVDKAKKTLLVEGGIRLRRLNDEANQHGLTMRNLGSIDEQSIVGAISTATHGSSLRHGLLSDSVRSLRIVLANGQAVRCSRDQNQELFKAALVSLGALGIVVEVEFEMIDACNIEWTQTLLPLNEILRTWDNTLWTQKEYTRVWWMPYMKRAIVWSAEKTDQPLRAPVDSWYGGSVGFHTYHNLLALSNWFPSILPWVEWFVFGMQYGFRTGQSTSAVEPLRTGLLMNCLYSQFVNEWALPLSDGPEAIERLSAWLNGEPREKHEIPFSSKGLYVHCPIEVRVSDTSKDPDRVRPYLDNTAEYGPTLYLNATLYRAYLKDPPCRDRYYEAFEWLMRKMGAKPHYAKNFMYTSSEQVQELLGNGLQQWAKVRDEADPEGMFIGEWHRRSLGLGSTRYALEEREVARTKAANGGQLWVGEVRKESNVQEAFPEQPLSLAGENLTPLNIGTVRSGSPSASSTASSFDMVHGAETEKSHLWHDNEHDEDEDTDKDESRYHGNPKHNVFGTAVFDKM